MKVEKRFSVGGVVESRGTNERRVGRTFRPDPRGVRNKGPRAEDAFCRVDEGRCRSDVASVARRAWSDNVNNVIVCAFLSVWVAVVVHSKKLHCRHFFERDGAVLLGHAACDNFFLAVRVVGFDTCHGVGWMDVLVCGRCYFEYTLIKDKNLIWLVRMQNINTCT